MRLLPLLVLIGALMLGAKLGALWLDMEQIAAPWMAAPALAAEGDAEAVGIEVDQPGVAADATGGAGNQDASPGDPATIAQPPAPRQLYTNPLADSDEGTLRAMLRQTIEALVEEELEAVLTRRRAERDPDNPFSESEVTVLQDLAKRREALDGREKALAMRENLMRVAEQRVDDKITELKEIEATIKELLERYDGQEEAQLKSLVKIYENMKPKDAARIFEQLDLEVLLGVAERMREAKLAPILARMDAAKAQTITVELANRRPLPDLEG